MASQELGRMKHKLTNLESSALAERSVKLRDDLLELYLVIIIMERLEAFLGIRP